MTDYIMPIIRTAFLLVESSLLIYLAVLIFKIERVKKDT